MMRMTKEVLSKEQIEQIAHETAKNEAEVGELRRQISAAPLNTQRLVKRLWRLKQRAERLAGAETRAAKKTAPKMKP